MIEYQYFPRSSFPSSMLLTAVNAFKLVLDDIDSAHHQLSSNEVLQLVRPHLEAASWRVETGKKSAETIPMPVLFGRNGEPMQTFEADAVSADRTVVLEVEAGRAVVNYQFLKDIFQACMMQEVEYLAIAVRRDYRGNDDFEKVCKFMDTLHASNRLRLPLDGILIIGY